jgi:hypothetical protein
MKLYDLKAGVNTRRVRIFLAEKGVTFPTVEVDRMKGENLTPEYLGKNPMGRMPLLELDDGTFIAESVAICRYVEELHPRPSLFGTTPLERAVIEMWNRRMEFELLRPITDHFVNLSPFWEGGALRSRRPDTSRALMPKRACDGSTINWRHGRSSRAITTRLPTSPRSAPAFSANTRGHRSRRSLRTSRNGSIASPSDRPPAPEDDLAM